jgi:hypothetical protein
MSTSPRSPGCPSSDDLSAAADGSVPEEIAVHLESCLPCQRDLATLHRIDRAVRSRLTPPAGLAERIRQRINAAESSVAPAVLPRWWLSPVLRLAAAVVITAASIAVLVHMLNNGATPSGTVVENDVLPGSPAPLTEPVSDGPLRDTTEVSGGRRVAQSLPRLVRHVWTVSDSAREGERLRTLLPKGSYAMDVADGNTVFNVKLTDRDLLKLVDRLASDGTWQLASPDLPQPGQPSSVALTGRNLRYNLVLVNNGGSR